MDRDLTGSILSQRYELRGRLGAGAFGAVYEARNELGKRFAVKVLLAPHVTSDAAVMTRFFREAKAAAAIESTHIVDVYETGVDPNLDVPFLVMELLRGEDLEKAIERLGALDPTFAARVISQAALGLERAHAAGVVHRDIKPANLFLSTLDAGDVVVKVLDFGIAKAHGEEALSNEQAALTRTGTVMGTPLYMSPEQAQGLKTTDARADVWSLGVCLYHALSGQLPWGESNTLAALCVKICAEDAPPIRDLAPWLSPDLAAVVHRALERDPARRTASMRALIDDLAPFCGGSTHVARASAVGVGVGVGHAPVSRVAAAPSSSIVGVAVPGVPGPPRRLGVWIAAGVVLACALAAVVVVARSSAPATPAASSATTSSAPSSASTEAPTEPVASQPSAPIAIASTAAAPSASAASPAASAPVKKPAPPSTTKPAPAKSSPSVAPTTHPAAPTDDPFGGTKN